MRGFALHETAPGWVRARRTVRDPHAVGPANPLRHGAVELEVGFGTASDGRPTVLIRPDRAAGAEEAFQAAVDGIGFDAAQRGAFAGIRAFPAT